MLYEVITTLGYASLARFFADHRGTIGCSYELVRQMVYAGRVPRADTLLAVLSARNNFV